METLNGTIVSKQESPSLDEEIHQLWVMRFSNQIDPLQQRIQKIKQEDRFQKFSAKHVSEIILLEASIERATGPLEKSWDLIAKAREVLNAAGIDESFQLWFQIGCCRHGQGKYGECLLDFQRSAAAATNPIEEILAKINIAVCRFNLGLPYAFLLDEIKSFKETCDLDWIIRGIEHIEHMALRENFAQCRFDQIFLGQDSAPNEAAYYKAYLASFPWFRSIGTGYISHFVELASQSNEFFQRKAWLHTLTGSQISTLGHQEAKDSAVAERIYLWAWKWIENPESLFKDLLEEELSSFNWQLIRTKLTTEDRLMMQSALNWLSLFNHLPLKTNVVIDPEKEWPVFFRMDRIILQSVQNGTFMKEKDIILHEYPALKDYFTFIEHAIWDKVKPQRKSKNRIIVKLLSSSLVVGSDKVMMSEPMTSLLALLKQRALVSFEEVAIHVFDLSDYDDFIHTEKIHNLIQRVKRTLPEAVELRTKEKRIIFSDPNHRVQIEGSFAHFYNKLKITPAVSEEPSEPEDLSWYSAEWKKLLMLFESKDTLSRSDIQFYLGKSRSSTIRYIDHLVERGSVKRYGHGKSTRYKLAELS